MGESILSPFTQRSDLFFHCKYVLVNEPPFVLRDTLYFWLMEKNANTVIDLMLAVPTTILFLCAWWVLGQHFGYRSFRISVKWQMFFFLFFRSIYFFVSLLLKNAEFCVKMRLYTILRALFISSKGKNEIKKGGKQKMWEMATTTLIILKMVTTKLKLLS